MKQTIEQYWEEVGRTFRAYQHAADPWRFGQAAFNVLSVARPDLSERVRGSNIDPFFCRHMEDDTVKSFSEFVANNW